MRTQISRIALRLTAAEKQLVERAAAQLDVPVSTFARNAALRAAGQSLAQRGVLSLSQRMRGVATAHMGTDEIMRLTRRL